MRQRSRPATQVDVKKVLLMDAVIPHFAAPGVPSEEIGVNLRRLKYFVKIVDVGSLTQAANCLHIAQPALSQQLATLEGEVNQQLLIRTKRGVTPTEAGRTLYRHALTILWQCEQAQSAIDRIGTMQSGNAA